MWVHEDSEAIPLEVKVIDQIFFGTFSTYVCKGFDTTIRLLVKEDGNTKIDNKKQLTIYINPHDILEYGG